MTKYKVITIGLVLAALAVVGGILLSPASKYRGLSHEEITQIAVKNNSPKVCDYVPAEDQWDCTPFTSCPKPEQCLLEVARENRNIEACQEIPAYLQLTNTCILSVYNDEAIYDDFCSVVKEADHRGRCLLMFATHFNKFEICEADSDEFTRQVCKLGWEKTRATQILNSERSP